MRVLKAVLFDLDGTLVDSAPDIRQALNMTLRAEARRDVTLDEVRSMVGDGMLVTLGRAFALTGAPITDERSYALFQRFIAHYRDRKADPAQIYPHAPEALDALRAAGLKLGLCTNKQEAATRHLLDQLDLTRYFDAIAGGDTFMVHKPHPGHLTGTLERMGIEAADSVMVGDSANDVNAARAAGMPCIAVAHGYGSGLEALGADALVAGFDELMPALRSLGYAF